MKLRLLSGILAASMMLSLCPVSAFADGTGGGISPDAVTAQELDTENDIPANHSFAVSDEGGFQAAVAAINNGSGEYEIVLQQDITLTSPVTFSRSNAKTTIRGGHTITFNGTPTGKGWFVVNESSTLRLGQTGDGMLTIKNTGSSPSDPSFSVVYANGSVLDLTYCVIDGGGSCQGVGLWQLATSSITNSRIQNCTRGVIVAYNSTLNMTNSSIENCHNTSYYGGGLYFWHEGQVTLTDCRITNCSAQSGGGIYEDVVPNTSILTLDNTTISGCSATRGGGGLSHSGNATVILKNNSSITGCHADLYGGGLYMRAGNLTMENGVHVTGCSAAIGGGLYASANRAELLKIGSGVICNNTATESAADLYLTLDQTANSDFVPDAAGMQETYTANSKNYAIDGWYPDTAEDRYTLSKHVEPVTSFFRSAPLNPYSLVASYKVFDIVFSAEASGKAYDAAACTEDHVLTAAHAGETVYLKYTGGSDQVDCAEWKVCTGDGTSVAVTQASGDTPAHFTMPDSPAGNKVTVSPVLKYKLNVTGGKAYAANDMAHTTPLDWAKAGETVRIVADAADPAEGKDTAFANWSTDNTDNDSITKVNNSTDHETTFTMPDAPVSITAVNQYKVTVNGGTAFIDNAADAAASIYAKENQLVHLQYTGNGPFKQWNWDSTVLPGGVDNATAEQASFTMPDHAVTITTSAGLTPITPYHYGILVQLPEGVDFAEYSTPVTVSVADADASTDAAAQVLDGRLAASATEGQTVTLKFDLSSLPEGCNKTFGEWKVTPVSADDAAEADSIEVTGSTSMTDAYFTMPASPVIVTFTLNDVETPENPDSTGSGAAIAGAVVAGAAISGATYLVGTRLWLDGLYGYIPENRVELALALWNRADCPVPESTELYPDIDEDDTDAQQATRWCVEQQLMKDYHKTDKDGNETVTFKPGRYVFRLQSIQAWYKLQKQLNEQQ